MPTAIFRDLNIKGLCLIVLSLAVGCGSLRAQDTLSLDQKIGQMIMVGFRGLHVDSSSHIADDIRRHHIGGVILFDYDVPSRSPVRNVRSGKQVRQLAGDLQQLSDLPLFVAIDQEGGTVVRLKERFGFPETVSARRLGELDNADTTRYFAGQQARLLDSLGINVNFAPVVDLDINPRNPVIGQLDRSFSADPEVVVRHAGIFVSAFRNRGVLPVLKHFPGHGSSSGDTHEGWVDVTGSWSEKELVPYRRLIETREIPAVMTAHVFNARLDSADPATLSRPVIRGLLRERLGFRGLVFSDDMQMKAIRSHYSLGTAIRKAIEAGVDQLVFANNSIYDPDIARKATAVIRQLVESGEISRQRIDRSYRRIMDEKNKFAGGRSR